MFSTFLVGAVPFKTAFIHGMLRAKDGRKFSKSLNNGINPLEVIEEYGTDALRMALTIGVAPGQDMNFDLQKVNAYKKFANKIWNVTRFILTYTQGITYDAEYVYSDQDQELLKQQDELIAEVTKEMDEYKYYLVGEKLYHYVWHEVADIILEDSKAVAESSDEKAHLSRQQFLLHTLITFLKLLHPFMPFITEEIWQTLPFTRDLLMVAPWPGNKK
jgi:valyl-tRNA synthetase